jgi:hypothetical protein
MGLFTHTCLGCSLCMGSGTGKNEQESNLTCSFALGAPQPVTPSSRQPVSTPAYYSLFELLSMHEAHTVVTYCARYSTVVTVWYRCYRTVVTVQALQYSTSLQCSRYSTVVTVQSLQYSTSSRRSRYRTAVPVQYSCYSTVGTVQYSTVVSVQSLRYSTVVTVQSLQHSRYSTVQALHTVLRSLHRHRACNAPSN